MSKTIDLLTTFKEWTLTLIRLIISQLDFHLWLADNNLFVRAPLRARLISRLRRLLRWKSYSTKVVLLCPNVAIKKKSLCLVKNLMQDHQIYLALKLFPTPLMEVVSNLPVSRETKHPLELILYFPRQLHLLQQPRLSSTTIMVLDNLLTMTLALALCQLQCRVDPFSRVQV